MSSPSPGSVADEAFSIVEDGKVVFAADHDELTLPEGMKLEDIPVDPTWRLEADFREEIAYSPAFSRVRWT